MQRTEDVSTATAPPSSSRHEEKAIAFFGLWAIFGLYLDGWAHTNNKPETFFSPWHGVLYSGVTVAVAYFAFREYILRKQSTVDDPWLLRGFLIFGAGAVSDFVWHEIFGIEADLAALLSPTHLLLLTGGVIMLSFGVRAALARNDGREFSFFGFLPTAMSLTLVAALVMFFTQYYSAFEWGGLGRGDGDGNFDFFAVAAMGAMFITTALFIGTALFALRHWQTPIGTFTLMFGLIAVGITGMDEFSWAAHIPGAVLAGLVVDVLANRLRPSPERRREAIWFAGLASLALSSAWIGAIYATGRMQWPAELWTGTIFLTTLEGVGLGLLVFPKPTDRAVPSAI